MALEEHDREDLVRDGTAMAWRGECEIDGTLVTVGFRAQGQLSLYWGAEFVLQFNQVGQLRRAYWNNQKLAAENGRLAVVHSPQRGAQVKLVRELLTEVAHAEFIQHAGQVLRVLRQSVDEQNTGLWQRAVPDSQTLHQRLQQWFAESQPSLQIAAQPNA